MALHQEQELRILALENLLGKLSAESKVLKLALQTRCHCNPLTK